MRLQVIALLLLVSGCAAPKAAKPDRALNNVGEGLAGVAAHIESAERNVGHAIPHTNDTGKNFLKAASDEHTAALSGVSATKEQVIAAQENARKRTQELEASEQRYKSLEGTWYVRVGRFIQKALLIVGGVWLACGLLAVISGLSPLGWLQNIGKELVRFVPFMNPFSWVRDLLVKRSEKAASKSPVDPLKPSTL